MKFTSLITLLSTLFLCSLTLSAQTGYEAAIREDPSRAAGVHHAYEYIPSAETPAPEGYKAFYVSHYGRHGSRRATNSTFKAISQYIDVVHDAGILTAEGEALYTAVKALYADHVGMVGELTARGAREHRGIAQRLYDRHPGIWSDKSRPNVYVQSSNIPRCLVSMANFTSCLDDNAPQLRFDFITGDKYLDLMAHDYYDDDKISAASGALRDSLVLANVDSTRFMKAIFVDDPERVAAVVPSPLSFMYVVWGFAGMQQCTETPGDDIFTRFFTMDELIALYRCYNPVIYNSMGNSIEWGDNHLWAARDLARDIIDRADAALADGSDIAADLRFGHDSGILPLAGLMDLVGAGDRLHNADATDSWQSYRRVCMASNLQLVFFRKQGAEPLVKIYYNEEETRVRGLEPAQGPYYRWSDLKAFLEGRITQYTF